MKKENSFIGHIDLLALLGAEFKVVNATDCIVIPVNMNPTIEVVEKKKGGIAARLNLFISDAEGRFGNSHYIVPSISKRVLERYALSYQDARQYCPILGNLKAPVSAVPSEDKKDSKHQQKQPQRVFNNSFLNRN